MSLFHLLTGPSGVSIVCQISSIGWHDTLCCPGTTRLSSYSCHNPVWHARHQNVNCTTCKIPETRPKSGISLIPLHCIQPMAQHLPQLFSFFLSSRSQTSPALWQSLPKLSEGIFFSVDKYSISLFLRNETNIF